MNILNKKYIYSDDPDYMGPNPMTYRLHAIAFLECAENSIMGYREKHQADPNPMQCAPLFHLICHAIEMLLKLALYKTGSSHKDLKAFQLRHNLSNLKDLCEEAGVVFSSDVVKMVETLSPLHEKHKLRYTAFEDEPVWLPFNPMEMIKLAKLLVTASHPSQSA